MHKSLLAKLLLLSYLSLAQFAAAQGLEALAQNKLKEFFRSSWSARRTEVHGKDAFEEIPLKGLTQAPNVVLREHQAATYKGNRYQVVELDNQRGVENLPSGTLFREILAANEIMFDEDKELETMLEKQTPPSQEDRNKKDYYYAFDNAGHLLKSGLLTQYDPHAPKGQAIILTKNVTNFLSVANAWSKTEEKATFHRVRIWEWWWCVALIEKRSDFSEWIWRSTDNPEIQVKKLIDDFRKNEEKEDVLLAHETVKFKNATHEEFPNLGITFSSGDYIKCKYGTICHNTANVFIRYLEQRKVIDPNPTILRDLPVKAVKKQVTKLFSVSRILAQGFFIEDVNQIAAHEFVVINLKNHAFIIQSNAWNGTSISDAKGVVELTAKELSGLFENDETVFEKLFGVTELKFSVSHVDWYPIKQT